jgi:D-alanyl-D-alanine carboxypeptidase/D-alanyl-D-alanine-endopeptidase (penicillin-binding protein 4)
MATTAPPGVQLQSALAVLDGTAPTPATGATGIDEVLDPLIGATALGGQVGATVVDLSDGSVAYATDATVAQTPASTLKILTTAAALEVLGPEHTFTTKVVTPAPGLSTSAPSTPITLVGGGDPTLTGSDTPGATRLTDLADATATALGNSSITSVELTFDDALFSGPAVDPDWKPDYVPSGVVAPVSALAVDGGRTSPDDSSRSDDPARAAASDFAAMLGERGISVDAEPVRVTTPAGAVDVASVRSASLGSIVEHVLDVSDNDAAEVLARHAALGSDLPGTSDDAGAAVTQILTGLGVDLSGSTILDGSGLARESEISAAALATTLALAADEAHPQLRPVISGLPVAGFTGTLDDRFDDDAGAGIVRAKTGTLTGVSTLAGVTVSADGTPYAFAVMADDVRNTIAARSALDDVATAIATCRCGL